MDNFERLMADLTRQELALLCRLNTVVGRELLVTCNIYRLIREDLLRVCEPLVRRADQPKPFLHSYKLTARGSRFLSWLRSESSRRSHVGS